MSNDSFEKLKSEVIAHLRKLDDKDKAAEFKKAIEYFNNSECMFTHLDKSLDGKWIEKAGYGVGTVRIWKGKKYKKVSASPVRWVRVFDKMDRGAKSSMTRLIHKVQACKDVNELYQFCMSNHSLFQDGNGVDLPIMDKLRAAIDERSKNIDAAAPKTEKKEESKSETKNFTKPALTRAYNAIMMQSSQNIDTIIGKIESALKDNPNSQELKTRLTVANKIKELGDDKAAYEKIENAIENNTFNSLKKEPKVNPFIGSGRSARLNPNYKRPGKEKTEEESKTYWIQDPRGNRLTNEDAKKEILGQVKYLANMEETIGKKMKGRMATDTRYYIDYLTERLNPEDRKEVEEERKKIESKKEKPEENKDYSTVKSENADNPNGKKIGIAKATIEDYDYNGHTKGKKVTIPLSKAVKAAFNSLDAILTHGKKNTYQPYNLYMGVQHGYLTTTDGRQLKRVKIDGLDDYSSENGFEAKIEGDNLVLKEQPLAGRFPATERVIPKDNNNTLSLDNKTLKNKIKELSAAHYFKSTDDKIDILMDGNKLKIGNTVIGKLDNYSGKDFNIRVNYKFLMNAMTNGNTSVLNFNPDSTSIDNNGNSYLSRALAISENTGDSIFMPMNADNPLENPDNYLKDHYERGENLKNSVVSSFKQSLDSMPTLKDVDKKIKTAAMEYMSSLDSVKSYKYQNDMLTALPLLHKILNDEHFTSMGLKPEFGKVENSKYLSFRDKNGDSKSVFQMDNPGVANFVKYLAKNGAFGEMKKSELEDMTSLESYVRKSIDILKNYF